MSLDSNVVDLATRIGEEIKDVRADMALISGGGGAGTKNVFIQEAEPTIDIGTSALWIQKSLDGSITFNLIEN